MVGKRSLVFGLALFVVVAVAIWFTSLRWRLFGVKGEVGFITSHVMKSMEDSSDTGYMKLRDYLEEKGYRVGIVRDPVVTLESVDRFDSCILFAPERALSREEVEAIHSYVERGGGFLVTSTGWAGGDLSLVNNITDRWGFRFMDTKVYEPQQGYTDYGVSVGQYTVAGSGLVEDNPIASRITYPFIMRDSCTINITDPDRVTRAVTLKGYAFGEDGDLAHQDLKPNREHCEPVGNDAVVMVNGEAGSGRVVGMGGHKLFNNQWIFQSKPAQNAETLIYILDWLTERRELTPP